MDRAESAASSSIKEVETKLVALVTGSATGIGANIAIDLAAHGYHVIVTGRNITRLKEVAKLCNEVSSSGERPAADTFVADLLDLNQVDQLIAFIKNKFKRLDLLINNACWRGNAKSILDDLAQHDLRKVLQINVSVPMYLIHKCVIPLRETNRERSTIVINISSIASHVVVPLHLYTISKACLSEMSQQVANLCTDLGITSITISPGPVLTNERPHHQEMSKLTLMSRVGTTQEISNLVLFAVKHSVMFNGQELYIDGGYLAKQRQ